IGDGGQHEMLRALELSPDAFAAIIAHCEASGVGFLCTPFDPQSLDALVTDFGQTLLKFGSGDLTNAPLLHQAARLGCDLILSTGMADLVEVETALGVAAHGYGDGPPSSDAFANSWKAPVLRARMKEKVALLHCTSQYPADPADVNLSAMSTLRDAFGLMTGYSDHTLGDAIPLAAIAQGAQILEKHITLDKSASGPDHAASMEPQDFIQLAQRIRTLETALGDGVKAPRPAEADIAAVARKSVVAARDIAQGEVFTSDNLTIKRPSGGLAPIRFWDLIGRAADRDYKPDEAISPEALDD
ncbi:MAG: N-acetylneuraminate synthase family protein, partial [Pseudomonadota bacterium]